MQNCFKMLCSANIYTLLLAAFSICAAVAVHLFNVSQKPKIVTSNTVLLEFLTKHLPALKETYRPPWFAFGGRIQSALGNVLRMARNNKLNYKREILYLKDGGQLGLDFLEDNTKSNKKRFVVLILPGLTSCSNKSHVKTIALTIVKVGAVAVVLNNRGLGGVPLTTPRTYCATNSDDVKEVIVHLNKKYGGAKLMAIGVSLGGMTLCRYLINFPDGAKQSFVAAMVISICWDPLIGNANLERPFINKYIVNYILARHLRNSAKLNRKMLETGVGWDLNKVMRAKTISEYDDALTAPMFGFSTWEDYYKAAQVTPEIHKFSIPVVGLNAMDDPMQPGEHLPFKQAESNESKLALIITKTGGHLGFLEGVLPWRKPFHYMERVVQQFVQAVKDNGNELQNCQAL